MRTLIFEDSEHNLASAREFAEKVKGEHEVAIVSERPGAELFGIEKGEYDIVLTDLYMPTVPGRDAVPFGVFAAMKSLQHNIPVAIVTDGKAHGDDPLIKLLDVFFLEHGNGRFRVYLVNQESNSAPGSPYYSPTKGVTPEGKAIKDWEYCFRDFVRKSATA